VESARHANPHSAAKMAAATSNRSRHEQP